MLGSLRGSQITVHFRAMHDPSGGQLFSSDALFTVAKDALTVGNVAVMLQDQGGGLQLVSNRARKLNSTKRGNANSA
jgi:hypothetical protein